MLIKTNNKAKAIEYLKKDYLINLNMLGILENVPEVEIFVDDELQPTGVLLRKNYFHYIHSKSDEFIRAVAEDFFSQEGFYGFSGVEESIAGKIRSRHQVNWESLCRLYYLPAENLNLKLIKNKTEGVRPEDAETVDKYYTYRNEHSLEAIRGDIKSRPSSAIYIDDEIASWVLVHDDNSMGIMYTKEIYRRRGYGVDVSLDLARKITEAGKTPFLQIVRDNSMSPGLAEACGFVETGSVEWFGIVVGVPEEMQAFDKVVREGFIEAIPFSNTLLPDRYVGMYQFLCNFKEEKDTLYQMELRELKEREGLYTWLKMLKGSYSEALDFGSFDAEAVSELINKGKLMIFAGHLEGNTVSTVTLYQHGEEEWGLFLLTTLPEYRGRGIGSKTLNTAMARIKNKGGYIAILQAPAEYEGLFKRQGFQSGHLAE